jgi:hypothetical protein
MEDGKRVDGKQSLVEVVQLRDSWRGIDKLQSTIRLYNLSNVDKLNKNSNTACSSTAIATFMWSQNFRCTFAMADS